MNDEREGCPSASGAERYINCTASFLKEQEAKAAGIVEVEREDVKIGTDIHALLAGEDVILDDHSLSIARKLREQELAICQSWDQDWNMCLPIREQRIWMSVSGERAFSGRLDLMLLHPDKPKALVVDHKSFGGVEDAGYNWQMKAQAALVYVNHPAFTNITAVVNAPGEQPVLFEFDEQALGDITEQIIRSVIKSRTEPTENPGKWCKWCKGKLICKKGQEWAMSVSSPKTVTLTKADVADMLKRLEVYDKLADDIRNLAKDMLTKDPNALDGEFILKKGAVRKTITDTSKAIDKIVSSTFVVSKEDLINECSLPFGSVVDVVRHKAGLTEKAATDLVKENLGDLVKEKENSPSLCYAGRKTKPNPAPALPNPGS